MSCIEINISNGVKKIILLTGMFLTLFPLSSSAWTLSGFQSPECIQADPETGSYYVSNIQGEVSAKDGNGYLSRIAPNGNTVIQKLIGGRLENPLLNAPKGLWITDKEIFVADIDTIKVFDKASGRPVRNIDLSGLNVKDLNDLAMDSSGRLYVCDRMTNRIFRISVQKDFEISVFKEGPMLGSPNGLAVNPKNQHLMVVTWEGGRILEIEPNGNVHVLKRGLHGLDGIDYDVEGNLYVSSAEKGEIYRIPYYGRGTLTLFMSGLTSPANISCDRVRHELLVPSLTDNSVSTFPLFSGPERKPPAEKKK